LLIDRFAYFEPEIQTLLRFALSDEFQAEVDRYAGYDVTDLGVIRLNGCL
jgi:putative molybdopterin biosynthesis protein